MSLRDPDKLLEYIDSKMLDDKMYYILLDEIQWVNEFEDVLNSYLSIPNADVYVTGSNARFLSKDVITEFRGRGDEIHIHPLSFREFAAYKQQNSVQMLQEYMLYGGLPQVVLENDIKRKKEYLQHLFTHTYLKDIRERNHIQAADDLDEIVNVIASSIGALTNPTKLANTFHSVKHSDIAAHTIARYLELMEDAFLIERSVRYDIKGRKYIDTPYKYYFEDMGIRNARIGFRQSEETHLLENMIYNELRAIGCSVDVGQVVVERKDEQNKRKRVTLEVDFVCNMGYKRVYIQSAYALDTSAKRNQEIASLNTLSDGFARLVICGNAIQPTYMNDDGIYFVNIFDFLQDPSRYIE